MARRSPSSRTVSRMNRSSSATTSSRVGSATAAPTISRSAHGLPCAARPTMTAAAPVVASTAWARARDVTSPDAITGTSTRSTSSAVSEWSAVPVYICFAERGCSVSEAAPASTRRGPRSRHAREPSSSPRRIFTETGTETAPATAATIRHARSGSSSSVAPAPVFVTLRTGQPKLMSTMSAPAASTIRAASAITGGSEPKIWIASGCSSARDPQVAERALVPVLDARAADHLGADEPGAVAAALAAERLHADAGHRREHEPARDLDRPDPPGVDEDLPASSGKW